MTSPTVQTPDASPGPGPAGSGPYHNAAVHFYRGEMQRMTIWRSRLDTTSHWAILLTTGITTFALGAADVPHFTMLLCLAINTICLLMEGRRYLHLHHSKWRIALLERNYFGSLFCPDEPATEPTWRQQLGADLVRPHYTITPLLATRLRLRRNYLMLFYFVTGVWLTKVFIHPVPTVDLPEFYARLAVGQVLPPWFVASTAGLFVGLVTVLAVITPSEEALEHWSRHKRSELAASNPRSGEGCPLP